jgi:hypothetical protein
MSIFKKSGWTAVGSNEGSASIGEGIGVSISKGELLLSDPLGANYKFNFATAGGQLGADLLPVGFDLSLAEFPDKGEIFTNSKWRSSLSASDFKGPFLIYQGKGISILGPGVVGSIMFFDIGIGLYSSLVATMATGGAAIAVAPAVVLASCSAVYVSVGMILGTVGANVSGSLGIIHGFEKKQSEVVGAWKVSVNGVNYKYAFYETGSCSWWKDLNMLNPDGAGRWSVNGDYLEINWDSGSFERWNIAESGASKKGSWTDPRGNVSAVAAYKTDLINLFTQKEFTQNRLSSAI